MIRVLIAIASYKAAGNGSLIFCATTIAQNDGKQKTGWALSATFVAATSDERMHASMNLFGWSAQPIRIG